VADAQVTIAQQTSAALTEVKNQVGTLVIDLSKKVLRRELANNSEQETYINQLVKDVKLN
jgi:F-type H+-transporting ATPase subunit b